MPKRRTETGKRGKASELQVAAELLRRGYNTFLPFVDAGIDLVAKVNERFVSIQVKKSRFYPNQGVYWQQIRKKPFDRNKGKDVFYVFVLRHETEINYLVVPSLWIEKHADEFYFDVKNQKWFFYFKLEDGRALEVRKSQLDMTPFLNRWDVLKSVGTAERNMVEAKLVNLGYRNIRGNKWIKEDWAVYIVHSSEFGRDYIRIMWREGWKDDHAIVYDYSGAGGPVCIVSVSDLFTSDFVKEKRKKASYANSGYYWSQRFPVDHELVKLVLSFEDRWDIL